MFWDGKTVLVTGSEGFIGRHLTARLRALKAIVMGIDLVGDGPVAHHKVIKDAKTITRGDIANYCGGRPEVIFHLAGCAQAGKIRNPAELVDTNLRLTNNALDWALGYDSICIVTSSYAVYGDQRGPFHEWMPEIPSCAYGTSKAAGDLLVKMYAKEYNVRCGSVRLANVYGPGDENWGRIVPATCRALLAGEPLWDKSANGSVRDMVFIDDVIEGMLLFAQKMNGKLRGKMINLSTGVPYNPHTIMSYVSKAMGKGVATNVKRSSERGSEVAKRYASWDVAHDLLGWKPKSVFPEGLSKTTKWYQTRLHV